MPKNFIKQKKLSQIPHLAPISERFGKRRRWHPDLVFLYESPRTIFDGKRCWISYAYDSKNKIPKGAKIYDEGN